MKTRALRTLPSSDCRARSRDRLGGARRPAAKPRRPRRRKRGCPATCRTTSPSTRPRRSPSRRPTRPLPGFQGYKVKRTGKYPKLAVEKIVYVSDDGKWFFDGDTLPEPATRSRSRRAADLAWIESRTANLYRTHVAGARSRPERDAAGLKGVWIAVETGFGPVAHARLRHARRRAVLQRQRSGTSRWIPARSASDASTSRRAAFEGKADGDGRRSSSTPTWSAATAVPRARRWTRSSRPTPASSPPSATTSSSRSGSSTPGR